MIKPQLVLEYEFLETDAHSLFRSDFSSFIRKAFRCVFPNRAFQHNWHIDAIGFHLQMVAETKIDRLMICIPPRSLKSFITSIALPAFIIGNDPTKTVLVVSHSLDLAIKLSNQFRQLISHPDIQEIFPAFGGALPKDSEREITTLEGGGRIAVSVDSNVTGRGGDIIIIDDPLDASDADNETVCSAVNRWLDETLSTRANDPATTPIILVMQRLSIWDPAAHLAGQEDWTQLSFPAIAVRNEKIPFGHGLYHKRRVGDLLHADRYPQSYLEKQRKIMGSRAFEAQFQQNPLPDGGGIVDLSKFRRYQEFPKLSDLRFYSIDAASGSDSGSYTVIMGFNVVDGKLYLTNVARQRYTFPELCRIVLKSVLNFDPDHLLIEKASNGIALIEHLSDKLKDTDLCCRFPNFIQTFSPKEKKITRMEQAMVAIEEGKILLPEDAKWLPALEAELRAFPNGRYNDQVDALSQAVRFFSWYIKHPIGQEVMQEHSRRRARS